MVLGPNPKYSEQTAARLDQEVRQILTQREQRVEQLIGSRKNTLVTVARALLRGMAGTAVSLPLLECMLTPPRAQAPQTPASAG